MSMPRSTEKRKGILDANRQTKSTHRTQKWMTTTMIVKILWTEKRNRPLRRG